MGITTNKAAAPSSQESIAERQEQQQKVTVAEVVRHGDKILIPERMATVDAISVLKRVMEADEMAVELSEEFEGFVWDGAWAFKLALEQRYGWVDVQPTPGFFGDNPPNLIGIEVDETGKTVQVPWGKFLCPAIPKNDGFFTSSYAKNSRGQIIFKLVGNFKQKYKQEFAALCALVRQNLRTNSLYKGKAIEVRFRGDAGKPIALPKPKFIRLDHISQAGLVFTRKVGAAISTNLFAPVEHTERVRQHGIPLKRGILLAGDYGVGKTLVAFVTAAKAVANGHTFIYCRSVDEFSDVLKFSQAYATDGKIAIVFCEDIDAALGGERDTSVNDLLNTLDGVDSKRHEVMTVLTTNNVEKIQQAALRPGRFDAIIHVERPDADAVERLIRLYAGTLLSEQEDLSAAAQVLAGNIPAVVREAVERSKLSAIAQGQHKGELVLTGEAILEAAETMKMQLELLEQKREEQRTDFELLGHGVGIYLRAALREYLSQETRQNLSSVAIAASASISRDGKQ